MSGRQSIWDDPKALNLDVGSRTERQLGLISVWEGGQRIGRQSGGMSCLPCEVQGGYVGLLDDCGDLVEYFVKRDIRLEEGMDAAARDALLQYLQKAGVAQLLELPHGYELGCEAFANVKILSLSPSWPGVIKIGPGILTWPNSD